MKKPLRIGVVGLVHTHVHGILGRPDRGDIEIVGIAEENRELAQRYADQHGFSMSLVYASLEEMLDAARPEAVCVFTSIYDHLAVTELCAARGIHLMVEKPMAVNMNHARRMAAAAKKAGVLLLTNYETTWYGSNHEARRRIHDERQIGEIRKVVFHDGHPGPIEIGCNVEFVEWLIDPVRNGGGAITDFGCYGTNLLSWLMKGERPVSVTAVTRQIKPQMYPRVDDDATILVSYPKAEGVIQASWNWPFNRKDMHVYGETGYIHTVDGKEMKVRLPGMSREVAVSAPALPAPHDDAFAYFAAVVRGSVQPGEDLSSLEINLLAMEILDAAVRSAKQGVTIKLD